ncbi:MAG: SGNH/GDSL hydrolase family protein, partial [Gordonia paraffinivorans]
MVHDPSVDSRAGRYRGPGGHEGETWGLDGCCRGGGVPCSRPWSRRSRSPCSSGRPPPGAQPLAPGPIRYVALGDSRAAAPSLTSFLEPSGCARSHQGYPYRVRAALKPVSFTDATCVAATTDDVLDHGQQTLLRTQRPQVEALRRDTTLVTLSIGGNDIAWASLLQPCFGPTDAVDSDCRRDAGLRVRQDAAFTGLLPKLQRVLDAIRQRSPRARVIVVGHGGYYGHAGCFPTAT